MPSSKFIFEGFLPKKKSEREKIIFEINKSEKTTILFESPHRLKKLLNEFKEYLGGQKEIEVYRELTKKFEQHIGNNVNDAIDFFKDKEVLGEITIVIKGKKKSNQKQEFDKIELKKEINDLISAGMSLSQASKYLAKKNNLKKSIIYDMY